VRYSEGDSFISEQAPVAGLCGALTRDRFP